MVQADMETGHEFLNLNPSLFQVRHNLYSDILYFYNTILLLECGVFPPSP